MATPISVTACVLYGPKDIRVVRRLLPRVVRRLLPRTNPNSPLPGNPPFRRHPIPQRSHRPHHLYRPLRLRPTLLQPLPQWRHPGARAINPRSRILRLRDRRRPRHHLPPSRRLRRPRSRPAVRHLQPMRRRALQHMSRPPLPQQRKKLASFPGHAAERDQPPRRQML